MNKTNAMRLLDRAGIEYTYCEYALDGKISATEAAAALGVPAYKMFKTLVTQCPAGGLYVFVIPGDDALDLKLAAKAAKEKRLDMLPMAQLLPLTGYIHGGCSPLCMKKSYPTFFDEAALVNDEIYVNAGRVGSILCLNPSPLIALLGATVSALTTKAQLN